MAGLDGWFEGHPTLAKAFLFGGGVAIALVAAWWFIFRSPGKEPAITGPVLVGQGPLAGQTVQQVPGTSIGLGPGPVLVTVDPVTGEVLGVVSPSLLVGYIEGPAPVPATPEEEAIPPPPGAGEPLLGVSLEGGGGTSKDYGKKVL